VRQSHARANSLDVLLGRLHGGPQSTAVRVMEVVFLTEPARLQRLAVVVVVRFDAALASGADLTRPSNHFPARYGLSELDAGVVLLGVASARQSLIALQRCATLRRRSPSARLFCLAGAAHATATIAGVWSTVESTSRLDLLARRTKARPALKSPDMSPDMFWRSLVSI
jgi:hypothetical protein